MKTSWSSSVVAILFSSTILGSGIYLIQQGFYPFGVPIAVAGLFFMRNSLT